MPLNKYKIVLVKDNRMTSIIAASRNLSHLAVDYVIGERSVAPTGGLLCYDNPLPAELDSWDFHYLYPGHEFRILLVEVMEDENVPLPKDIWHMEGFGDPDDMGFVPEYITAWKSVVPRKVLFSIGIDGVPSDMRPSVLGDPTMDGSQYFIHTQSVYGSLQRAALGLGIVWNHQIGRWEVHAYNSVSETATRASVFLLGGRFKHRLTVTTKNNIEPWEYRILGSYPKPTEPCPAALEVLYSRIASLNYNDYQAKIIHPFRLFSVAKEVEENLNVDATKESA